MISITAKKFCRENLPLVENYKKAVSDKTKCWHLHHRKETDYGYSVKELMSMGEYYGVEAKDLIFLTPSDHSKLHQESVKLRKNCDDKNKHNHIHNLRVSNTKKGVHLTESHKQALKKKKRRFIWATPDFELKVMAANIVSRCHKDWVCIIALN